MWSLVVQLVEQGTCNAIDVRSIPTGEQYENVFTLDKRAC